MRLDRLVAVLLLATVACDRGKEYGSGHYAREVAEAIPRIEQATGLKFKSPPRLEIRTRSADASKRFQLFTYRVFARYGRAWRPSMWRLRPGLLHEQARGRGHGDPARNNCDARRTAANASPTGRSRGRPTPATCWR